MLLSKAIEEFSEWGRTHYVPGTVREYRYLLKRLESFAGDQKVQTFDPTVIARYHLSLKTKGYSPASISHAIMAIRQFFKYLSFRRLIKWDYRLVRTPRCSSNSFPAIGTATARATLAQVTSKTFQGLRDRAILSFLYASGLRVSELCALQMNNLNLEERYGVIISKKNLKRRMIFWDDQAHGFLTEYLKDRKAHATGSSVFISLCGKNYGQGLTTRSVQRIVETYRTEPWITCHSYRHGLGMRAVQAREHPRFIQTFLGHKNLNSSQFYMDFYDGDVIAAYRRVTDFFDKNDKMVLDNGAERLTETSHAKNSNEATPSSESEK